MIADRLKNVRIVTKIAATFATLILIALAVNGFIYAQRGTLSKMVGWSEHTYEVLAEAAAVMASMVDQETGLRGYLITANPGNLGPYESGQKSYAEHFRKIKDLTSDNPAQQKRLEEIDTAVQAWTKDVAGKAIALMGSESTREQARDLERTGAGKKYFDVIRAKVAEVDKVERGLLSVRSADQEKAFANIDLAIAAGGIIPLVISILLTVLMLKQIGHPMKHLTAGMLELAGGKFDVVLPGLERKDEIGEVARAVETFKVKAAEKAQIEAAEKADRDLKEAAAKAESDRKAEEERNRAMTKVMEEFDLAVGSIAQAAMAGDFSKRVPLEGKEGVIRNLAQTMNAMCDNIGKVMDDVTAMMSALAEGDLTRRIHSQYEGQFAVLKDTGNMTAERLAETVADIIASAREVTNAAAEISTSTTDLSQRTEEQAASLEETSASMEQISVTVKTNAENAMKASSSALDTQNIAEHGGEVVAQAVEAMSRIEESARKIFDIISVIDEISRQTNLLALNAAVEAARAGEAGRGFAVVASEVRSLAQRSSQAAKDIKDLITNSTGQVEEGVQLVNKAGVTLQEIVSSIKGVAKIVTDIASASAEQASGIEQVGKALAQMDQVTQQNSALVEENAATAKTLEHQSVAMNSRVAFFKLAAGAESMSGFTHQPKATPRAASTSKVVSPQRSAPARAPAAAANPVGRMHTALATAVNAAPEWKEF